MMRHRRDSIWVFHSELAKIFGSSRGCPFQVETGKPGPVSIFRIERHVFRVAVTPVEKKIAFRVIASKNTVLRKMPSTSGQGGRGFQRRGYRGRSTRPLNVVLSEACRDRFTERWQAADNLTGPAPSAAEEFEGSVSESLRNEMLDMFGANESNNGPTGDDLIADGPVDLQDGNADLAQGQDPIHDQDQGQDLELEGLLAAAASRAVSLFFRSEKDS